MPTLFYSPAAQVIIKTARSGTLDVSADVTEGNLSLVSNGPHKFSCSLANFRRKYDGLFTPNDRIVVRLKRISWLQVFSGYLDTVPYFSAYPRDVHMEATCTLKRLQMTYWDPGATYSYDFLNDLLNDPNSAEGSEISGNLTGRAVGLLTNVGQWDPDKIHMGRLPADWVNRVYALGERMAEELAISDTDVGAEPVVGGQTATGLGTITDPAGVGLGWGTLPTTAGKIRIGNNVPGSFMYFTGESRNSPLNPWWAAIRVPAFVYENNRVQNRGQFVTPTQEAAAKAAWRNKKILVSNPANGRSLVLRVTDYGPLDSRVLGISTSEAIALSQQAAAYLGMQANGIANIRYARSDALVGGDGRRPGDREEVAAGAPVQGMGTGSVGLQTAPASPGAVTFASTPDGSGTLQANTRAARDFLRASWDGILSIGGYSYRTIAGSSRLSQHSYGLALDVMVASGRAAEGEQRALGNSVAMWFAQNPGFFQNTQIIWMDKINEGNGWRPYRSSGPNNPTLQHRDHVHISFRANVSSAGAMGGGWPGATAADFSRDFSGGFSGSGPAGGPALVSAGNWIFGQDPESDLLRGPRALMNDVPLMGYVQQFIQTSMRSFCSAPNGDFIAWFPDYFGIYKLAGVMEVRDIELKDFTMVWSDLSLITHQFTAGSGFSGPGANSGQEVDWSAARIATMGIATVENPEILAALLNISADDIRAAGWLNKDAILQRFGARPKYDQMEALTDRRGEFWYALFKFQENWAAQFQATAPVTFMPEVFPGMLLRLADYGVQFYVDGVTHSWNMANGQGFSTNVHISAPSAVDGSGLSTFLGLARGR